MCEQSYDDDMREVNSKGEENGPRANILVPGVTLESMVVAYGGAWIPPDGSGEFNVPAWAGFLGRSERAVRDYLSKVEVRTIGDQKFASPEAFRRAFPALKGDKKQKG